MLASSQVTPGHGHPGQVCPRLEPSHTVQLGYHAHSLYLQCRKTQPEKVSPVHISAKEKVQLCEVRDAN